MSTLRLVCIAIAAGLGGSRALPSQDPKGVSWIGAAQLAADSSDLSGLEAPIPGTKIPQNRVGSIGSALAYTGSGNLYIALNDRGPSDGAVGFTSRFQTLAIDADAAKGKLEVSIRATTLFSDGDGARFTGLSSAFDASAPAKTRRFDPEGARVSSGGTLFTSDEYGPRLDEWSARGVHLRRLELPKKFAIAHPSKEGAEELPPGNVAGRQSNRGMEGLARSPDGKRLYGAMQSPLIQDGGLNEKNKRIGTNLRILELELATGATRELLYRLESEKNGVNEVLAADSRTLLVIERDSEIGAAAAFKRIYKVLLDGASDISGIQALASTGIPAGVAPLKKELLIDFLEPSLGLAGEHMPEKIEGLAFGPDLADGRHLLIVSIDNDFLPEVPNSFWAFAIERSRLPDFQPAVFDTPWKP